MNAPPPNDPQITERVADVVELLAKIAGGVGIVWAFLLKGAKPFIEWRRKAKGRERLELERHVREMFAAELRAFGALSDLPGRFDLLAKDHDILLDIALDNRERHDETTALLDFLGFTSDRRSSDDRREAVADMVNALAERRRDRRRKGDG